MLKKLTMFPILLAHCSLLIAAVIPAASAEVTIGKPAPEFTLPDATGTMKSLSEFKGRYVVLEWVNPECPFVRKHYGSHNMQRLQRAAAEQHVAWLSIDSSAPGKQGHLTPEQAQQFLKERDAAPTALLLDPSGDIGRLYGAKTTPHMFVINPDGVVIYAGAIDSKPSTEQEDVATAVNYVKQALDEALSGKSVSVPETRSYGCSVKYQ